jgi:transcriptional regulator with XRE-family HTH domain
MPVHGMDGPGNRIQRRRHELGLTQAGASRLAGLAPATWSAVESGSISRPRPRTKVRIARALATTPSSIWRVQPPLLHLHDTDDPRWEHAVDRVAHSLWELGTPEQRRSFGEHLIEALDCADSGAPHQGPEAARWERLWRIGGELAGVPMPEPIAIVDGRLVETGNPVLASPPEAPEITARRGGSGDRASPRTSRRPHDS